MQRLLFLLTIASLGACAVEPSDQNSPKAGDPGTYTRKLEDGTPVTLVIRDDGSLVRTVGDEVGTGTARTEGNEICFAFEEDEGAEYCWKNGPIRSDGTFESTGPDGTVLVLKYSPDSSGLSQ